MQFQKFILDIHKHFMLADSQRIVNVESKYLPKNNNGNVHLHLNRAPKLQKIRRS